MPTPVSANQRSQVTTTTTTPSIKQINRKPAPSLLSASQMENHDPLQRSPSAKSDWTEPPDDEENDQQREIRQQTKSHFSWSTHTPSVAPGRPSVDTMVSRPTYRPTKQEQEQQHKSHFSWSTVNTNFTYAQKPASPPPSPPPPIPAMYADQAPPPAYTPPTYTPTGKYPVQSVLSRGRPVQRNEKENIWAPPPRKASTPTPGGGTPVSANGSIHPAFRTQSPASTTPTTVTSASGRKALPLPPELLTASNQIPHLQSLQAKDRDIQLQKRNVLKSIQELEKTANMSIMDTSWPQIREAKRKLEEQNRRLEEVRGEEMEVGIAISRARRKEGEEEGLWVRRVTG